jgi:hypothetical protein
MSQVENTTTRVSELMDMIDLGPTQSVQFLFAKLQMAQSQICKAQAETYMSMIEDIQAEQKLTAQMIEDARKLQNDAKTNNKATTMPQTMIDFFKERNLSFDLTGTYNTHNADEWDYNIKTLTNYQEQIGNNTQTLMIYLQDFIGQYNSYQEGAMSAVSSATQTLRSIARGQ